MSASAAIQRTKTSNFVIARFGHEMSLVLGFFALALSALALISYSSLDPAWSTSGALEVGEKPHNWLGAGGAWLADIAYFGFGFSAWWVWLAAAFVWTRSGWRMLTRQGMLLPGIKQRINFWLGLTLALSASCALEWTRLYHLETILPGHAGGVLGYVLGILGMLRLGFDASALFAIAALLLGISWIFNFSWVSMSYQLGFTLERLVLGVRAQRERDRDRDQGRRAASARAQDVERSQSQPHTPLEIVQGIQPQEKNNSAARRRLLEQLAEQRAAAAATSPATPSAKVRVPPSLDLLEPPATPLPIPPTQTLEMISRLIEKKLKDLGVNVAVTQALPGPVLTRYTLEIKGVNEDINEIGKLPEIHDLAKDLARAMNLAKLRIVVSQALRDPRAPSTESSVTDPSVSLPVFLELPNAKRQDIHISEILRSPAYQQSPSFLTLALGKDSAGQPVVLDLASVGHIVLASATNASKTMGLRTILMSLLCKATPDELRLLLVGSESYEMSTYAGLPHLMAPIMREAAQAVRALNWCQQEMVRRQRLLNQYEVGNWLAYNARVRKLEQEQSNQPEHQQHPYTILPDPLICTVVVIEELAEPMAIASTKVQESIARLAQQGKALGLHLIVATQRPNPEVLTELIKANIGHRIAFELSGQTESRHVLGHVGAEMLLSSCDLLYRNANHPQAESVRLHSPCISDQELGRVLAHWRQQ